MRLLYLSPVPLASFAQRPHHFVRWFRDRYAAEVLWIDPYPARLPMPGDLRRLRRTGNGPLGPPWRDEPWISAMRVPSLPIEPLAPGRLLNRLLWRDALARIDRFVDGSTAIVAGKPCALALEVAARHPDRPLVFDAMDNVPAFAGGISRRWLARAEDALARRADLVIASSTALAARFDGRARRIACVRNGLVPPREAAPLEAAPRQRRTGVAGSSRSSGASAPDSLSGGDEARRVFGYVGVIARWFDWDAVIALARRHPADTVRLIGPCERPPPALPRNVECLPAIAQHHVYAAMRGFDAGLIPFEVDELTECVDPVKYYEYRAAGLAVISTRFGEMRLRGAADRVLFFDELDDDALDAAMRAARDRGEVRAFVDANSWNRRFDALGDDAFSPRPAASGARRSA